MHRVEKTRRLSVSFLRMECSCLILKADKRQQKLLPVTPFTHISLSSYWLVDDPCPLAFNTLLLVINLQRKTHTLFYIGNFKTIITLCVKNVQRNL